MASSSKQLNIENQISREDKNHLNNLQSCSSLAKDDEDEYEVMPDVQSPQTDRFTSNFMSQTFDGIKSVYIHEKEA